LPLAVWDLRTLSPDGPVREWFDRPQASRQFGFAYDADDVLYEETVAKRFDALIFVDQLTPSAPPSHTTD
jgi:hypothetical protein